MFVEFGIKIKEEVLILGFDFEWYMVKMILGVFLSVIFWFFIFVNVFVYVGGIYYFIFCWCG